jgi:Predicted periplasmic lipoprotein (DUF2279)
MWARHSAWLGGTSAAIAFLFLLLLAPAIARGQEDPDSSETRPFQLAPSSDRALAGVEAPPPAQPCSEFKLFLADERPPACQRVASADDTAAPQSERTLEPPPPIKRPWQYQALSYLVPAGVVIGAFEQAITDGKLHPYHFTNERWFGANTYAGGADKAAHFVDYTILSKELAYGYERLGYSRTTSLWVGFGVTVLSGLANEFGDGFNKYGFSFQDLTMDTLGAATSTLLMATGNDDLIGFRYGFLLPTSKVTCCAVPANGRDYSYEIYTADLKLAGVGRRLRLDIGPLKYLLFSVTYGSKYYPSGIVSLRERQVGFEIGLNFEEILNSLGVRRDTWWGYAAHVVMDNTRFPFTSVGFQYDLNHGKWYGPGNGNQYASP